VDQRTVDLELADREADQLADREEASAEVADRDRGAEPVEPREGLRHAFGLARQGVLGQLELESLAG
jgi:hypothetical protein